MQARPVAESQALLAHWMGPMDANPAGNVHGGTIMRLVDEAAGVAAALRQSLGKDPEIVTRVDPAILGGLRVKVGSRLFDASLRTRLDQMKFALRRA